MPFVLLLLLMFASNQAQADPIPELVEPQSLAAFNFAQDTLGRPHITAIRYDRATERFYWKDARTGKARSMDQTEFLNEIWRPYCAWTEAQQADPVKLAESGDATTAFNRAQDGRDAAAAFKAVREGREVVSRPHVDRVWYDDVKQLFHWTGPAIGKEMSMSREQFIKEIWYPYYLWVDSHNWY